MDRFSAIEHQLLDAFDAGGDDAGRGVFLEALAESAALAPIEREHRAIRRETGKRRGNRTVAIRASFARAQFEPTVSEVHRGFQRAFSRDFRLETDGP